MRINTLCKKKNTIEKIDIYFHIVSRNGYYIKKGKGNELILNINKIDFIKLLESIDSEWINFRIYERDHPAPNGLTHNMKKIEHIKNSLINANQ